MYHNNGFGVPYSNLHPYRVQDDFDFRNAQDQCQKYLNYHVIGQLKDGSQIEGIIEDVDDEGVTMLVPEDVEEENDNRIYGGYGRRRYRRYRRRRFPFFYFAFPFIFPFPFYY